MAEQWTAAQMPDLTGKVAVVTGGNSGIGLGAVRELARKGARVILAARSEQKGNAAVTAIRQELPAAQVELRLLDLADLGAVRAFAAGFLRDFDTLDLLINNAGIMAIPYHKTADGLEVQLGTNHFGHFALTGLLLIPLLAAPAARIVTVSSGAHRAGKMDFDNLNWEHGGYNPWRAYGRSKLANLLFAFELQRRLERAGARAISVAAHPGYTATNLQAVGPQMEKSVWKEVIMRSLNATVAQPVAMGALPTLYAATAPDVQGGDYIGPDGWREIRGYPKRVQAVPAAHNEADAAQLWARSEAITRVQYTALETARA